MTLYGLPYFLEDKTGSLLGSEFIDLHDRMHLTYRCTASNSSHTAFMIFQRPDAYQVSYLKPLVALDFGPNHNLGTISFSERHSVEMNKFLVKVACKLVSPISFACSTDKMLSNAARKFTASDGQQYTWSRGCQDDQGWTVCVAFFVVSRLILSFLVYKLIRLSHCILLFANSRRAPIRRIFWLYSHHR